MKFLFVLLSILVPTFAFADASLCVSKVQGYSFDNCAPVGNQIVITSPRIAVGTEAYAVSTIGNIGRLANFICGNFSAGKLVTYTTVYSGDNYYFPGNLAYLSDAGALVKFAQGDTELAIVVCAGPLK